MGHFCCVGSSWDIPRKFSSKFFKDLYLAEILPFQKMCKNMTEEGRDGEKKQYNCYYRFKDAHKHIYMYYINIYVLFLVKNC